MFPERPSHAHNTLRLSSGRYISILKKDWKAFLESLILDSTSYREIPRELIKKKVS